MHHQIKWPNNKDFVFTVFDPVLHNVTNSTSISLLKKLVKQLIFLMGFESKGIAWQVLHVDNTTI